jgi:hypothetical protein
MVAYIRPIACCTKDPAHRTFRAKRFISNGAIQVYDFCRDCNRIIHTHQGLYIPHPQAGNIDALPVLEDMRKQADPCVVCGSTDGSEYHHWAPANIFGIESERYPGNYLCRTCHSHWHKTMEGYNRYAKRKE